MQEEQEKQVPVVYWVIGDETDVGKTTVATALIRVLNQNQIPTVGFKPFGGSSLRDVADFMVDRFPGSSCAAYGPDALKLAKSSPLTSEEHVDLVAPAYFFYYPNSKTFLLARTGSASLGNVEYYKSEVTRPIFERPDIQTLFQKARVPIAKAQTLKKIWYYGVHVLARKKIADAFRQLVTGDTKAVVCEGAWYFLPSWEDCPVANHVLLISSGVLHFYPNMNFSLGKERSGQVTTAGEVVKWARNAQARHSLSFCIAPQPHLHKMTEELVENLIRRSKLIH